MDSSNIRSGTITAIEGQVRDPERVSIFLDGAFAFGLNRLVAAEHGLHKGLVLDAARIAELLAAEEASRALSAAVQFLAHRPRSRREVETRLARRDFSQEAIGKAISRLEELGYLNDSTFARIWVENRVEHQPRGRRLLRQELRQKGVDSSIVDEALEEAEIDELPAALQLARRRAESLTGLDPEVQRRRLAGYLQRRGYGWDVVRRALDATLGGRDSDEPEM